MSSKWANRDLTNALRTRYRATFMLNPHTAPQPTGPTELQLVQKGTADLISYGALCDHRGCGESADGLRPHDEKITDTERAALSECLTATAPRPTLIAMRQILLRAVVLLGSWAIGLLVAAWVVPGVSLSVSGFIVAVVVFSVAQAILSLLILKLPHEYASLLLGGTGLALTLVALILASVLTHGLTIRGIASWMATTVLAWLVTTVGVLSLPELLARDDVGST